MRKTLLAGGTLPPIIVFRAADGWLRMIDGHHRYWAHVELGRKAIAARTFNTRGEAVNAMGEETNRAIAESRRKRKEQDAE